MKYSEMNLDKDLLKAIHEMGFEEPTDIQSKAIPLVKEGKDVIGQSETGSGKTAAFGLPILEKVVPGSSVQAIIIAPTRELAEQIGKHLRDFAKHKKLHITVIYGGVGYEQQINNMRNSEIIVGTPGRLLDHIRNGFLYLGHIKTFVLDEADKMFEMGFIEDIREILNHTPAKKQMLMFSATVNYDVEQLIKSYMVNPVLIRTKSYVEQSLLKQYYYDVPRQDKFSLLYHLLKKDNPKLAIVFCSTRRQVDFISRSLQRNGVNAMPLHGGLSQAKRNDIMDSFRAGKLNILVASDVAARGIDIKDVTHIFNYGIPKTPKEYVHRVGRTARMGNEGVAINLLDEMDYQNFNRVLEDHSIKVDQLPLPSFQRMQMAQPSFSDRGQRGQFGNRGGFGDNRGSGDNRMGGGRPPRYGGGNNFRPTRYSSHYR